METPPHRHGAYSEQLYDGMTQAAGLSLMPSVNLVPRTTSARSGDPFNDRQPFEALLGLVGDW
jgi:hypothetical protein